MEIRGVDEHSYGPSAPLLPGSLFLSYQVCPSKIFPGSQTRKQVSSTSQAVLNGAFKPNRA